MFVTRCEAYCGQVGLTVRVAIRKRLKKLCLLLSLAFILLVAILLCHIVCGLLPFPRFTFVFAILYYVLLLTIISPFTALLLNIFTTITEP